MIPGKRPVNVLLGLDSYMIRITRTCLKEAQQKPSGSEGGERFDPAYTDRYRAP